MGTPNSQSRIPRPIIFPSDSSAMRDTVRFPVAPVPWQEPTHYVGVELLERCTTAQKESRECNFDRSNPRHVFHVSR
jgi:hypothetical protein